MNCDQVFSILTRGPFPTGDPSDVAVEMHLDGCGGCCQIAEALRPSHDLLEESIPASEARDLPGYWGDLSAVRTTSAYAQVQTSALRAATLPQICRPPRTVSFTPGGETKTVGWIDVARLTSFLLVLTGTAFGMAWFWHWQ